MKIDEIFLDLAGEQVLYAPNPGNAGDALIAAATCQLFKRYHIDYKEINLEHDVELTKNRIVIYGGGGNLVDYYHCAKTFIAQHHKTARRFIIFPHTILAHADLLAVLGKNVDIICREQASFDFVTRHSTKANVYLADDIALGLDVALLLEEAKVAYWPVFSSPKYVLKNAKRTVRVAVHRIKNKLSSKKLFAFRTDLEAIQHHISYSSIDASEVFCPWPFNIETSHEATYRMLKFLNQFETIYTDRLHVCIAALLLKKNVHFYNNTYGKSEFVYEFSLKHRFQNITFHGSEQFHG